MPPRPVPAPRTLTRKERADQTRQRMIRAAYDLFLERGYEATTMQDVATSAGVAVQTTYYTFKTKSQLLAEVETFAVLGDRPSSEWRTSPLVTRLRSAATVGELVEDFVAADTAIKEGALRLMAPMLRLGFPKRSRRITDSMIQVIETAASARREVVET